MLRIEKTQTYGWDAAIRGMRNPKNSWNRMDSNVEVIFDEANHQFIGEKPNIGPNDMKLMKALIEGGAVHRKFLRMITVTVDITAPLYWWKEFDTYKVGTVANSCSTMHKVMEHEFTNEDFSTEAINDVVNMFEYVYRDDVRLSAVGAEKGTCEVDAFPACINDVWDVTLHALNNLRKRYLREKDEAIKKKYWKCLIQMLPTNYMQKRTVQLNYEVLRGMMRPDCRLNHKLTEWSVNFVDWVRTLPYADELIFEKGAENGL